jgi:predicted site-specific integrase-resolvase
MNNYIPIYEYCKKYNTSKQNVYRWIREGKIKDFKKITKEVERIVVLDEPHITSIINNT